MTAYVKRIFVLLFLHHIVENYSVWMLLFPSFSKHRFLNWYPKIVTVSKESMFSLAITKKLTNSRNKPIFISTAHLFSETLSTVNLNKEIMHNSSPKLNNEVFRKRMEVFYNLCSTHDFSYLLIRAT